ncbi:MAG: cyanophycinase [Bacteroidota bacterium]
MTHALWLALLLFSGSALAQGRLLLVGGGEVPPEAVAWFVAEADSSVLVLDYEDAPGQSAITRLEAAGAAVTYLPIASREAAALPSNVEAVRAAHALFLPGGDQAKYVERWHRTPVAEAVREVYMRGGLVGGTSAGAMILSEVVFDARRGSFSSDEGLRDPLAPVLSLTDGFIGLVEDALIDTHFTERSRYGRLLALLANYHAETGRWVRGLGIDEGTALAVDPGGIATAIGTGAAVLVLPEEAAASPLRPGEPLARFPVRLARFTGGLRFHLATGALVSDAAEDASVQQ